LGCLISPQNHKSADSKIKHRQNFLTVGWCRQSTTWTIGPHRRTGTQASMKSRSTLFHKLGNLIGMCL